MPVSTTSGSVGGGGTVCFPLPEVPEVSLPLPFTIPSIGVSVGGQTLDLCCTVTLPTLAVATPPIPLGLLGPGATAVLATINQGIKAVSAWVRARTPKCPLD